MSVLLRGPWFSTFTSTAQVLESRQSLGPRHHHWNSSAKASLPGTDGHKTTWAQNNPTEKDNVGRWSPAIHMVFFVET